MPSKFPIRYFCVCHGYHRGLSPHAALPFRIFFGCCWFFFDNFYFSSSFLYFFFYNTMKTKREKKTFRIIFLVIFSVLRISKLGCVVWLADEFRWVLYACIYWLWLWHSPFYGLYAEIYYIVYFSVCIIIRKAKSVDNLGGIVIQNGQPLLINHCPSIMCQKKEATRRDGWRMMWWVRFGLVWLRFWFCSNGGGEQIGEYHHVGGPIERIYTSSSSYFFVEVNLRSFQAKQTKRKIGKWANGNIDNRKKVEGTNGRRKFDSTLISQTSSTFFLLLSGRHWWGGSLDDWLQGICYFSVSADRQWNEWDSGGEERCKR